MKEFNLMSEKTTIQLFESKSTYHEKDIFGRNSKNRCPTYLHNSHRNECVKRALGMYSCDCEIKGVYFGKFSRMSLFDKDK